MAQFAWKQSAIPEWRFAIVGVSHKNKRVYRKEVMIDDCFDLMKDGGEAVSRRSKESKTTTERRSRGQDVRKLATDLIDVRRSSLFVSWAMILVRTSDVRFSVSLKT
jgi:hypothetical protein